MFAEQRLQQLNEIYGANAENLPPVAPDGERPLVQDGARLTVPLAFMDSLSREVFEDSLARQTLSLADARAAATAAREERGRALQDAWRDPRGQYGQPATPLPSAGPVIARLGAALR